MEGFGQFVENFWSIWIEAAPWLFLGLIVAGLLKAWFPTQLLQRWLSGRGLLPILRAAVIGTPLPLCSCSVLPAAIQLRRSGASKGSTVSFLIATPENGADSIAISYVLLGPLMTLVRVIAALLSAVTAGSLTAWFSSESDNQPLSSNTKNACPSDTCCETASESKAETRENGSTLNGLRYAFTNLFDDIAIWLLLGIVVAALIRSFVPPSVMAQWGSGLVPMLAVVAISVPMYICATASTPVAASLLLAGVSPGTVLVFLLAGPASNISSVGLVKRELGSKSLAAYLFGVIGVSVLIGLLFDGILAATGFGVTTQQAEAREIIPEWFALLAGVLFALLTVGTVCRRLGTWTSSLRRLFCISTLTALFQRLESFSKNQQGNDQGGERIDPPYSPDGIRSQANKQSSRQ